MRARDLLNWKCLGFLGFLSVVSCGSSSPQPGFLSLTWMITSGGVLTDCASVGADAVQVLSDGVPDTFNCDDEGGTTFGLEPGNYNVTIDLLQCPNSQSGCPGGIQLNQLTPLTNINVISGQTRNLGNFVFAF